MPWRDKAQDYLKTAHLYQLGALPTEGSHPETMSLSTLAVTDLPVAISTLQKVDVNALEQLVSQVSHLDRLRVAIARTRESGHKIFLCGCGATGRLSLTLEKLWRDTHPGSDEVVSFMAGGDIALVHSLEGFEDYPEYGSRHLEELGFVEGDLLISTTEGGETPYVIGATERAAELSSNSPYFLYCNPRKTLSELVERSRRVFENSRIIDIELYVGPMALAGSTRMQASTVLELSVGLALFASSAEEMRQGIGRFLESYKSLDLVSLASLIKRESQIYREGCYMIYQADDYGITIFTDTTERAPTFSLQPFAPYEVEDDNGRQFKHSLCYVMIPRANNKKESWRALLNRDPRSLNWPEIDQETLESYLRRFDFSREVGERRQKLLGDKRQVVFSVKRDQNLIKFSLEDECISVEKPLGGLLFEHILVKVILNIHSTLVMGRLGRYKSNLMTWVSPSNGKLINRSARYLQQLYRQEEGCEIPYEEAVRSIFKSLHNLEKGESVVLSALQDLKGETVEKTHTG